MWLALGFLSALLLGIYDVSKKVSLQNNAVIPVLFTSILFSCSILSPFLIISNVQPHWYNLRGRGREHNFQSSRPSG
jgi:hypothetical protein